MADDPTQLQEVEEEEAPKLPVSEVEHLLSTLAKALRAFVMYQENNPVFQRFQSALREAFDRLWEHGDELELVITEQGFRYHGSTFSVGSGRDNLAFAFYKDGIRSLIFLPGFEEYAGDFLEAVQRATRNDRDADDLISVLWEEDFPSLRYGYVDLLMEGLSVPDQPLSAPGGLEAGFATSAGPPGEEAEIGTVQGGAPPAPSTGLSTEDFDETLYFLDQDEMGILQKEVRVEMERDLRTDVLNALFDRLEEPNTRRQEEILAIFNQLLPLFLSRGDMGNAARILEELDRLQATPGTVGDALKGQIDRLFDRLSDPQVLEQFVQAVEDGAVSPDSQDVNLFFSRLHAQALPVLIRFAEMSESSTVRERLSAAIDGLATRYPDELNRLLASDEAAVVIGAVRAAGSAGLGEAVPGLERALERGDRDVRLAVVRALTSIRLNPALTALTSALQDEDRDVRVAAASALGAVRFASARPAFEKVITGKQLKDADLTEKMAFFEAYGALGGQQVVDTLGDLLNSKGFLGRRNPTEIRACAALGLGRAGTPAARTALERARSDDDPIVRNAVVRALKGEGAAT